MTQYSCAKGIADDFCIKGLGSPTCIMTAEITTNHIVSCEIPLSAISRLSGTSQFLQVAEGSAQIAPGEN